MQNKIALITGATSGIGKATAIQLAKQGMHIILACRNLQKTHSVKSEITAETGNENIKMVCLDLASLESVYDCAQIIKENEIIPDIFINNAGVFNTERKETIDGLEQTMAVNYYGHYLLTLLLLPLLKQADKHIRIINVSSKAALHANLNINKLNFSRRYHSFKAYGTSKLAQLYFTRELAKRLIDTKITVNAVHPGSVNTNIWNIKPNLVSKFIKKFSKTPEEGAETIIYLATSSDVKNQSGKFFGDKKIIPYTSKSSNQKKQFELWEHSMKVVMPWVK